MQALDCGRVRRHATQHYLVRDWRHVGILFVLRLEDGSDAARRSPCEGGHAIHTGLSDLAGLLDLSLGHDHGDVSD